MLFKSAYYKTKFTFFPFFESCDNKEIKFGLSKQEFLFNKLLYLLARD